MKRSRADRREHGRWVPLARARLIPPTAEQIEIRVRQGLKLCPDLTEEQVRSTVAGITATAGDLWANDRYQVHVIRWEPLVINGRDAPVIQLSIRRLDRAPARDWRDLQRIKNQLVGAECEGIEIYPAESRLLDTANQFHLWVVADPEFRFPFGYHGARVVDSEGGGGAVQRPLDDQSGGAV